MDNEKIYKMLFSQVYPLLIVKAEKKGRTCAEVPWKTKKLEKNKELNNCKTDLYDSKVERIF